jgi:hypothetical protein
MEVVARKEEVAVRRVAVVHLAAEVAPLEVTAGMVVTQAAEAAALVQTLSDLGETVCVVGSVKAGAAEPLVCYTGSLQAA